VAPPVSKVLKDEPELVWHANDVKLIEVITALNDVRVKFARAEAGDHEHAHPRNCVMTLLTVSSTQAEERRALRTCRIIGAQHPAQAIVIREDTAAHARAIDAWIVTDVHRPDTACAVECEILTLHVPGAAADHVAALVDPLLISGVPTFLWWMGTPPFGRAELYDSLRVCDALVFDSARFEEPYHAFRGLSRLISTAHHKLGLADLQWSRLRPWREAIAQFFMPSDRRAFLSGITEVGIDYAGQGRGNRLAATMITGWIASSLGWRLQRATAGPGGVVVARYTTDHRSVEVNFRSVPKEHLANGELSAFRLAGVSRGTTFRLQVLRDPDRPRGLPADPAYRSLLTSGGEDDAGIELAKRRAEWHRDVLHETRESLHHTSTGDPPGESVPKHPVVFTKERRRPDTQQVLLTTIEIGEGQTLRHVQQVEVEEEAMLLLDLLATGTHDRVFNRSLQAGFDLMRKM
jgi:glucose-6-phosphate dehydrogenase assembly protein OpcA